MENHNLSILKQEYSIPPNSILFFFHKQYAQIGNDKPLHERKRRKAKRNCALRLATKKIQREQILQFTFPTVGKQSHLVHIEENSGCAQNQKSFIKVFGQHPLCTRV
jgi:hypothetical protein